MNDQRERNGSCDPESVRGRLERALAGEIVDWPVYAVYDWFVQNRAIDWPFLFEEGLGRIAHADFMQEESPNVEIVRTTQEVDGRVRRDARWITDLGELRESHLGEWRQEFLIKTPADYRIMQRALEGTRYTATAHPFQQTEREIGNHGITLGHLGWTGIRRTPVLQVQIDFAGPERTAMDLVDEVPELMELLELMTELTLEKVRQAAEGPARYIKLWENLSLEMIGLRRYRQRVVPIYRQILDSLAAANKRLVVHYDGKLRAIGGEIAALDIDGIDSFTPPPEGDMSVAEARACWPEKFLWLHPPLGWHDKDRATLAGRVRNMVRDAGPRRYCLMISEDIPPKWHQTVPLVLRTLDEIHRR